jgi:oligopeptide/dipeptide ABC transporter ATP-binding protein
LIESVAAPIGAAPTRDDIVLDVRDLRTYFHLMDGVVKAVDGVSFSVKRGGRLALVGESGCGKSVTAMSILRLIDIPPGEIVSGEVLLDGQDLLKMNMNKIRHIRGGDVAMIFQEPMTSLNPVLTIGDQLTEAIILHQHASRKDALGIAIGSLRDVGVQAPERRVKQYPHEMSGGMRQRIMIAMALSCKPKLLIADEPTTALDVTIQAQILELIQRVQEETGAALLLITHDLGVVAEMVDEVAVMYAGRIVEQGTVEEVMLEPKHPYAEGLLSSVPSKGSRGQRLSVIKGSVPNPFNMPKGCNFAPRCPYAFEPCATLDPRIEEGEGPAVACWLWKKAPGYDIPKRLHDEQVENARRAAEATTQPLSEIVIDTASSGPVA